MPILLRIPTRRMESACRSKWGRIPSPALLPRRHGGDLVAARADVRSAHSDSSPVQASQPTAAPECGGPFAPWERERAHWGEPCAALMGLRMVAAGSLRVRWTNSLVFPRRVFAAVGFVCGPGVGGSGSDVFRGCLCSTTRPQIPSSPPPHSRIDRADVPGRWTGALLSPRAVSCGTRGSV